MTLILASSSSYRQKLIKEAGLTPLIFIPDVNETAIKIEMCSSSPLEVAQKLAFLKSENVYLNFVETKDSIIDQPFVIIGSDQVCVFKNQIFDKPGSFDKNFEHLKQLQGQTHSLITCVCLLYKNSSSDQLQKVEFFNQTDLKMKTLSDQEIKDYLEKDKPFDCAGGYKFESLGHTLMESVTTSDETAIQGLPMTETLNHLKKINLSPF